MDRRQSRTSSLHSQELKVRVRSASLVAPWILEAKLARAEQPLLGVLDVVRDN